MQINKKQGWMCVGRNRVAHYYQQVEQYNLYSASCGCQSTDFNPEIYGHVHANTAPCLKCLKKWSKMQSKTLPEALTAFINLKK